MNNKLIIAAAGSGKTTFLVNESLKITDKKILITTFTDANTIEIKKKFIEKNGYIPTNITIQPWFSFLLQHGIRPYQEVLSNESINGLQLVNGKSVSWIGEKDIEKHYFNKSHKIYSDKISKFVCKCNDSKSNAVINRISTIFSYIFIDEVQDLAGWDLEIIKRLFASSSYILLVGDPRQATYSTNDSQKNRKFKKSEIINFFETTFSPGQLEIDTRSLTINYRCNDKICSLSNKLFPSMDKTESGQKTITNHDGIFLVREEDIVSYLDKYTGCIQLRNNIKDIRIKNRYPVMNFGESKGLGFARILIYPTKPIISWFLDHNSSLAPTTISKLYVAITRAQHSVGIVYNYTDNDYFNGLERYIPDNKF